MLNMLKKMVLAVGVVLMVFLTVSAGAAGGDGFETRPVEESIPWAAIFYAAVAVAAICAIGFKDSKRTHLD